ncbi:hypothetical protein A3709_18825 [Halioglobus sp. HI00S01]|uniref:SAM-dependent methyltransferase n=1 Tax=Halioglobus sp. HI00S01 TaxID=1822214 RepID=UPI0007C366BC|nr:SAM-dependent methyltransferase [Halioglobus sp. HI00S01]KZX57679.1 hypothetical protein A3709_18825 [Halioglobus sp. HI00S01]
MRRKVELAQHFTPSWIIEAILANFYPRLAEGMKVLEPTAGDGRWLMALPDGIEAAGIELDEAWAAVARRNTHHEIITGDALTVEWPFRPDLICGNPPFSSEFVRSLLDRAYEIQEYGGQVGLLLPAYFLQTAATVVEINRKWSVSQTMIPRNIFQNMKQPLIWARFEKEKQTVLSGLFLYHEADAVLRFAKRFRCLFVGNESSASAWGEAVEMALISLGGEGSLSDIYRVIEGKTPTPNPWWKEQVRKICAKHFRRVEPGRYALERSAALPGDDSQLGLFAA